MSGTPHAAARVGARRLLALALAGACAAPAVVGESGSDVARCEIPPMQELFPSPLPPNPDDALPHAGACIDQPHDVIVVLGCPSLDDGGASPCQIERADIAVGLAQAGYASRFIVSGAAVHNDHEEASALRDLLVARGIAPDAILLEPEARHTDENLYFSSLIMQREGFVTALVVSESTGHLLYVAVCDSNCCVDLGRLTLVELDGHAVGHYVLYPDAEPVSDEECAHLTDPRRGVCLNLGLRKACKDDFQL